MILGVILGAGTSGRMGAPKAFLAWKGGPTFLESIARNMADAGLERILAVVRPEHETQALTLAASNPVAGLEILTNADPLEQGPISSVQVALRQAPQDAWGLLVAPVDHPGVSRTTYQRLIEACNENPGQILVPAHGGHRGHPTLFPAEVFADLENVPAGRGADWVLEEHNYRIVEVGIDDPHCFRDIDTPEDYSAAQRA